MEKIKDLLKNISERLSNPLVFSFICSWLIINWRISLSLLWYDSKQITNAGFNNIFAFIESKLSLGSSLITPLAFAILYTLLLPIVRNLISALNTWAWKWGDNWNLKIMKGGKIPIDKYFSLRKNYDERTKILEEVIKKENESLSAYDDIKTALLKSQTKETQLTAKVNDLNYVINKLRDITTLNGYWLNTFKEKLNPSFQGTEKVYIDNGQYYVIDEKGHKRLVFTIVHFYFDITTNSIFFIKKRIPQETSLNNANTNSLPDLIPNSLRFVNERTLSGDEYDKIEITYEKIPETFSIKQDS